LTLWFSVVLCAVLILTGVIIHTVLQRHLYSEVEDNLRLYTADVQHFLNSGGTIETGDYDTACSAACTCSPSLSGFDSPGIYVRLIDKDGNVVGKSNNLGELELPVDPSVLDQVVNGETGIENITTSDGTKVRFMASLLPAQSETLILEVGQSLLHIDAAMSEVRWALLGSILAALALAIISGDSAKYRVQLRPQ
jgi:hypothetical protein